MDKTAETKKTVLRWVILAVLSAIIGVNFYIWNALYLAGNTCPMPFGFGASVVLSGSMEPELSVGDLLIIRETGDFGIGDIVVYPSGSMAVVHRVVEMDGETVTTRGDANNAADSAIPRDMVQGKVICVIPLVGYGIWAMKTPEGVLITVLAALILLEVSYRSEKEKQEQKKQQLKEEIRKLMQEIQEKN